MSDNKDLSHIIAGHKATISNPNTSEEAKNNSRHVVEELAGEAPKGDVPAVTADGKHINNVISGHKADLVNPRSSEESKEHSKEVIEELS